MAPLVKISALLVPAVYAHIALRQAESKNHVHEEKKKTSISSIIIVKKEPLCAGSHVVLLYATLASLAFTILELWQFNGKTHHFPSRGLIFLLSRELRCAWDVIPKYSDQQLQSNLAS